MGLVLALTTGYWQMFGFGALNAVTSVFAHRFRGGGQSSLLEQQAQLEIRGNRFIRNGRRLPRSTLLWSRSAKADVVAYLNDRAQGGVRQQLSRLYSESKSEVICLGLTETRAALFLDWKTHPHTLIIGPTGSGKSALLSRMLSELNKFEVGLWLFDYKAGETIDENRGLLQAARSASSGNPNELSHAWRDLLRELDACSTGQAAKNVLVIEELATALEDPQTAATITQLAAQGRSVGLRIIATNQSSSGIPRNLIVNLGNRILLDGTDLAEQMLLAPNRNPANHLPPLSTESAELKGVFDATFLNRGIPFKFLPVWSE